MDNMVGIRIRQRRDELNLTPKDIKSLTGIGSGHLSEMETGKKLPSTPTLIKLSEVLKCSIDWILTGRDSQSERSDVGLSDRNSEIISLFNRLKPDDQEEIIDIMKLKIKRRINQTGLSFSKNDSPAETA